MACVLTYHKIGPQRELGITTVGRHRLASHLDYLAGTGRPLMTACAAAAAEAAVGEGDGAQAARDSVNGRRAEWDPARGPVAVTFDDGYDSVYTDAFPELETRRIPATVFAVVGAIGGHNTWDVRLSLKRARHLSWTQVEELARLGIEFGSHGLTHRDLTALGEDALREELVVSKRTLEEHTGKRVEAIAYPFGKCDRRVIASALEAGYNFGFTSWPAARAGLSGGAAPAAAMAIGRMSVYCLDGRRSLARKLGGPGHRLEVLRNLAIARLSRGTILVKGHGRVRA